MSGYIPNEEEREVFERYLDRNGIEDEREVQRAWSDFRDDLDDGDFRSGRQW